MLPKNAEWIPDLFCPNFWHLEANGIHLAQVEELPDGWYRWRSFKHLKEGVLEKDFKKAKADAERETAEWFDEVMR